MGKRMVRLLTNGPAALAGPNEVPPHAPARRVIDEQGHAAHTVGKQVRTCPAAMLARRPRQPPRALAFTGWQWGYGGVAPPSFADALARIAASQSATSSVNANHPRRFGTVKSGTATCPRRRA